jgi:hypothetical protein
MVTTYIPYPLIPAPFRLCENGEGPRKEGLQDRLPWWNLGNSIVRFVPICSNGFWIDGALVGAGSHFKIKFCVLF